MPPTAVEQWANPDVRHTGYRQNQRLFVSGLDKCQCKTNRLKTRLTCLSTPLACETGRWRIQATTMLGMQWGSVSLNPNRTQKKRINRPQSNSQATALGQSCLTDIGAEIIYADSPESSSKLIEERTALALAKSSGIAEEVAIERSIRCETLWRVGVSASTRAHLCNGGGVQKTSGPFGGEGRKGYRGCDCNLIAASLSASL